MIHINPYWQGQEKMLTADWAVHAWCAFPPQSVMCLISKLFILYRAAAWFCATAKNGILLLLSSWGQQLKWTEFRQMGPNGMGENINWYHCFVDVYPCKPFKKQFNVSVCLDSYVDIKELKLKGSPIYLNPLRILCKFQVLTQKSDKFMYI